MASKRKSVEILELLREERSKAQKKLYTFRLTESMVEGLDRTVEAMNQSLKKGEKEFSRTEVVELAVSTFMKKWR